jgi:hypothetical protein
MPQNSIGIEIDEILSFRAIDLRNVVQQPLKSKTEIFDGLILYLFYSFKTSQQ